MQDSCLEGLLSPMRSGRYKTNKQKQTNKQNKNKKEVSPAQK